MHPTIRWECDKSGLMMIDSVETNTSNLSSINITFNGADKLIAQSKMSVIFPIMRWAVYQYEDHVNPPSPIQRISGGIKHYHQFTIVSNDFFYSIDNLVRRYKSTTKAIENIQLMQPITSPSMKYKQFKHIVKARLQTVTKPVCKERLCTRRLVWDASSSEQIREAKEIYSVLRDNGYEPFLSDGDKWWRSSFDVTKEEVLMVKKLPTFQFPTPTHLPDKSLPMIFKEMNNVFFIPFPMSSV